jgi:hypothetical protein
LIVKLRCKIKNYKVNLDMKDEGSKDVLTQFLKNHLYKFVILSIVLGLISIALSFHLFIYSPDDRPEFIQVATTDTVSVNELERIRNRIDNLEKSQKIRRGYYLDTLSGERILFGTFLTLIIGLGGFVGFGIFQRRIRQIEDSMSDRLDRIRSDLFSKNEEVNDKMEGYFNNAMQDIDRIEGKVGKLENKILKDHTEIFNYIHREKRYSGSDLDKGESILYKTKAILNQVSQDVEEDKILKEINYIKRIMKNMYDEDIGFFDSNLETILENINKISDLSTDSVSEECDKIISGIEKMEELDPPLPF